MDHLKILKSLRDLVGSYPEETAELAHLAAKKKWTAENKNTFLNRLADVLLVPVCTLRVAEYFGPLLLELLHRCVKPHSIENLIRHEALCLALGRLMWLFPEAARFAYKYFDTSPSILVRFEKAEHPPRKKHKVLDEDIIALLIATLQCLAFDLPFFKKKWDWSVLTVLLKCENIHIRWLSHQCVFRISNTSSREQRDILLQFLKDVEIQAMELKYSEVFSPMADYDILKNSIFLTKRKERCEGTDGCVSVEICSKDYLADVTEVQGILLERISDAEGFVTMDESEDAGSLVMVNSTKQALQQLALAVSGGIPVLVQGPVGCGKTSLVEYLARLTGRKLSRDLLKVQLGDQTDSKLLIGSYCCTDIPGEFVWKPGVLTEAMISGQWLLLEDIDCAPMDIISMLAPIIQSQKLTLPGHEKPVRASVGFQLFATKRLLVAHGKSFVEMRSNAHILNKMWRKITMHNLTGSELTQVMVTKWPVLSHGIVERILKIYKLLSSEDLDMNGYFNDEEEYADLTRYLSSAQQGRLISTRDLLKYCKRIARDCDNKPKSEETLVSFFFNALDSFCDSYPDTAEKLKLAKFIAAEFNISATKAEYYCMKYKPEISDSTPGIIRVGRVRLPIIKILPSFVKRNKLSFAHTRQAAYLLEKVAVSVFENEPVLLVGETGTGKTSIVQYLAHLTNNKLSVINMNQQSDSIDLFGGYKPVDMKLIIAPLKEEFEYLFPLTFSEMRNVKFLGHVLTCYHNKLWNQLFTLIKHTLKAALDRFHCKKNLCEMDVQLEKRWKELGRKIHRQEQQLKNSKNPLAFSFIEGALVKAMKRGEWILLDEINLAEAETLQCLAGVLESSEKYMYLLEKGDEEWVKKDDKFRLFACMNPATDVGKKDLPVGIRNRFTEFFMVELEDRSDLIILVESYLSALHVAHSVIERIVDFYLHVRKEALKKLNDGTGHRPHYSLRTLCRALSYAASNPCGNSLRSLYEAFAMSFLSQLDEDSHRIVNHLIVKFILGKENNPVLKQNIAMPQSGSYICIQGYWIHAGDQKPCIPDDYILTKSVERNLRDLARIVSAARYPVLLQGETSVGKTSLVTWLAQATGNYCVRVNNHEHTDIQEYTGSYCVDHKGKLFFKEGVLVEAMRKGYWIILDELNLAPTEVMEALNRVLDDNRELFLTETQEVIKAHPKFMVFATQNPPGLYGGRKILSRAFRNRFIELHFGEIPPNELEVILSERCRLPQSYSKKMVAVMQELQMRRRESGVFAGKHGFITLRDLFRWGNRFRFAQDRGEDYHDWLQHIADEGYMLLAGRVRRKEEADVIREVIQKHLQKSVDPDSMFSFDSLEKQVWPTAKDILSEIVTSSLSDHFKHITWTHNMRRLAVLVGKALKFREPVLLVGSTGCGKTTVCQMFADMHNRTLHSVNCHMHSESADFLGNLRPVRSAEEKTKKLFEWVDGPLVEAMNNGDYFLADEISLADDSVLERLNSVLEPERTIRVTEKSGDADDTETLVFAKEDFRFLATMNPGGDYGKKELSPALRNRFTEIWCPSDLLNKELKAIVEQNISEGVHLSRSAKAGGGFGLAMVNFLNWFRNTDLGKMVTLSIRDVLTWVDFINTTTLPSPLGHQLSAAESFIHGACLVFLDGLGSSLTSVGSNSQLIEKVKKESCHKLVEQVEICLRQKFDYLLEHIENNFQSYAYSREGIGEDEEDNDKGFFSIGPFAIPSGPCDEADATESYVFDVPTTKGNVVRLMRAMQLKKPVLLEGSPGVGKTSIVSALAKSAGYPLVRINLSEQTDISDLFGADLPVEGGVSGQFAWRDGPLLQAIKSGSWILLDELNLASQQVLEGLNACLDHRGEIFVTELGRTFVVKNTSTRIFGCQNPFKQGGSRKGLPRSFLNRFTQVYMEPFPAADMKFIAASLYPSIPRSVISDMVDFNELTLSLLRRNEIGGGDLWNLNLRDIFRWCELMCSDQAEDEYYPGEYINFIYADRMRTEEDKQKVMGLFETHFGVSSKELARHLDLSVSDSYVQLGHSFIPKKDHCKLDTELIYPLPSSLPPLESLMKCIEMGYMAILVGPPASGKSSMVHFLANLTGHTLKVMSVNSEMDTTELVGGFEQVDFNRHLDHVMEELELVIESAITQCLMGAESVPERKMHQTLMLILSRLHSLKAMEPQEGSAAKGATYPTEKRIRCALELIEILEDICLPDEEETLTDIKKQVKSISDKIKKNGVSAGGQFEWVDSVLVTAVKKGYWLLIEDVNFCSPSVLDRLNGLLEPNGVLALTEQGAVGGEIVEIERHKNFRLILTMNPQHGEISPAMRNRGVEISLLCDCIQSDLVVEKDFLKHSSYVLQGKGVTSYELAYFLSHVQFVMSRAGIEVPSCYDFLSIASLCVQYMKKNRVVLEALQKSFETGFVQNVLSDISRCKSYEVLQSRYRVVIKEMEKGLTGQRIFSCFPGAFDFQFSCAAASIRRKTCLFTRLLDLYRSFVTGNLPNYRSHLSESFIQILTDSSSWFKVFVCALRLLYEGCSESQWQMVTFWLASTVSEFVNEFEGENYIQVYQVIMPLIRMKDAHFEAVIECQVVKELARTYGYIVDHFFNDFEKRDVPIDPRWNPYLYRKMLKNMRRKSAPGESDVNHMVQTVKGLGNQLLISICMPPADLLCMDMVDTKVAPKKEQFTLRSLSRSLARGDVQADRLKCPPIPCIDLFITRFSEEVTKRLQTPLPCFTEKDFWLMWKARGMFQQFVMFCDKPLKLTEMEDTFQMLQIHWTNLTKCIPYFFICEDGSTNVPLHICEIVQEMSLSLSLDCYGINVMRSKLFPALGCPSPIKSESHAKLFCEILVLCEAFDFPRALKLRRQSDQLKIILKHSISWSRRMIPPLMQILQLQLGDNVYDEFKSMQDIRVKLADCDLIQSENEDDDEVMEVCQEPVTASEIGNDVLAAEIEMQPFYDCFFTLAESLFLAQGLEILLERLCRRPRESMVLNVSLPQPWLTDLGLERLRMSPVLIGQLLSLSHDNEKREMGICLASFLRHLQDSISSAYQDICIQWQQSKVRGLKIKPKQTEPWWARQSPVLTSVCVKHLGRDEACGGTPLRDFEMSNRKVKTIKNVLWRNWDFLKNVSFKQNAAAIVTSWYWSVVSSMGNICGVKVSDYRFETLFAISKSLSLCNSLHLEGYNILVEASKSVQGLNDGIMSTTQFDWFLGRSFCFVGILTVLLFSVRDRVDPNFKLLHEHAFHKGEKLSVQFEWIFREWHCQSVTGLQLKDAVLDCHPYVSGLLQQLQEYERDSDMRAKCLVFRPPDVKFKNLWSDLHDFLDSMSLPSLLPSLIEVNPALLGNSEASALSQLAKKFLNMMPGFMDKIKTKYSFYQDLIYPFLTGAEMLSVGLQMMSKFLSTYFLQRESAAGKAGNIIMKICSFPSMLDRNLVCTPFQLASLIVDKSCLDDIASLCSSSSKITNLSIEETITSLLFSALFELVNEAIVSHRMSAVSVLSTASVAFGHFLSIWQQQNQALQMKKEQEESLFQHRVVTHGDEAEAVQLERERKSIFPSFHKDFREFLPSALEEMPEPVHDPIKSDIQVVISEKDSFKLWMCHTKLLQHCLASDSLCVSARIFEKVEERPDYVTPFQIRYKFLMSLTPFLSNLDSGIDIELIGSHILAATDPQTLQIGESKGVGSKYFDIYHDEDRSEVIQLLPILEHLKARIASLLREYPEEPILTKIKSIVERVESFPVNSPFLRFVTGLELILESAQMWERNAIKKVSLQPFLDLLTEKVISYRKMELLNWKQCLDSVVRKQHKSCASWWFHIYAIISDEGIDMKKTTSVLTSLQQFMEDSSIGQFIARLGILEIFTYHMKLTASTKYQRKLRDIFFNVYAFYKQFLTNIEQKVEEKRKPIEKEIKDYVKISQWSDRNFFSVQQAIDKSHRTLHKSMKKFEKELEQPARLHFVVQSKNESTDLEWWSKTISTKEFEPKEEIPVHYYAAKLDNEADDSIFDNLIRYQDKARSLCKKTVKLFPVLHDASMLNDLSSDIIQHAKELQDKQVKKEGNLEHQKKEAKLILQQRRKGLTDLFKLLDSIGLSYKKGLVNWESLVTCVNSLKVPLLNSETWSHYDELCSSSQITSSCWSDANHYYYKCVAQVALLEKCIQSPNRELKDIPIMERCKGFAGHLFKQIISQRQALAEDAEKIFSFSETVECFSQIILTKDHHIKEAAENSGFIQMPLQDMAKNWKGKLSALLDQTFATFQQLELMLRCCPSHSDPSFWSRVILPEVSASLAFAYVDDEVWASVYSNVWTTVNEVKSVISMLSKDLHPQPTLYNWHHISVISLGYKRVFDALEKFCDLNVANIFRTSEENVKFNSSMSFVLSLRCLVREQMQEFTRQLGTMYNASSYQQEPPEADKLKVKRVRSAEKLLISVLKSIEDFFTYCTERKAKEVVDEPAPDFLPEKLFSERIVAWLAKAKDCLRIHEIAKHTSKIVKYINCLGKSPENSEILGRYFLNTVPVLFQYSQLLKLYLMGSLASHRTSCKLLSILSGIFTDVVQKGFCIPPELQPPAAEKSGATEFHDIERGGLGEGEGSKDVSKDIKSEDQLDEVDLGGAEKQENENADVKEEDDGIEMSEDFKGEVYSPEQAEESEEDEDDMSELDDTDLNKELGDVGNKDGDLKEKLWGGDNEDEDEENDLKEDECGEGVEEKQSSELVAKDNKKKDTAKQPNEQKDIDECPDLQNEREYEDERPDPYIDVPPLLRPDGLELPENMEMDDEDGEAEEGEDKPDFDSSVEAMDDTSQAPEEGGEDENGKEEEEEKAGDGVEDIEIGSDAEEPSESKDGMTEKAEGSADEEGDDDIKTEGEHVLPSDNIERTEDEVQGAENATTGSSHDNVTDIDASEKWEGGDQKNEEQHKEGQADSKDSQSSAPEHAGRRSTARKTFGGYKRPYDRLRKADETRTLGDRDQNVLEQQNISEKTSKIRDNQESVDTDNAGEYEHVKDGTDKDQQAVDTATEEQASQSKPKQDTKKRFEDDDDDVIALSSSSDEENEDEKQKPVEDFNYSKSASSRKGQIPARADSEDEQNDVEMLPEGEIVPTLGAEPLLESSIHTQHDLWNLLSVPQVEQMRREIENKLVVLRPLSVDTIEVCNKIERLVSPLVQELCEQLRLVLEPTKMSKLRGDYRTGKRLNMRKIIPYIASQFRKDKIWLRRTKPSKREYQIILAVDDSSSMADNHSKELAFESLLLLGKSLALLEAGELAVMSFGEDIKLLHSFDETFTSDAASMLLGDFTFAQKKTSIYKLLVEATTIMTNSRKAQSWFGSKEISQLLVIISDGRGIYSEGGEEPIKRAIRATRANNIFVVFIILDSPLNKDSILSIQRPKFSPEGELLGCKSYIEDFPFPFYVILRNIEALPHVLGEALRQWFELVTSTER